MPAFTIKDESHVVARKGALEARLARQKQIMLDIDYWRHLDATALELTIYQNVPADKARPRKVIVAPNAYAVTNTCVALAATPQPKMNAIPVDETAAQMLRAANVVERIGYAMYHAINKDRSLPLTGEAPEHAFGRGIHIYKYCWLDPDARGEVREKVPVMVQLPFGETQPPELEQVVEQGAFPVLVQVLDPLDCWWSIGKNGRVIEFIHEYRLAWDELVDLYPDAENRKEFKQKYQTPTGGDQTIRVLDYWNDDINCILFDDIFYKKPAKHNYGKVPVVVERANIRVERNKGDRTALELATPICWPMIPALTWSSWTASLMATYLQFSVIQSYELRGVNSDRNPHLVTDPQTGMQSVELEVDFSAGGKILMLYDQEELRPIQGSDVSPMMQRFLATMDSYMAMTGMSEPILTGVYPVEPNSGYATVQQRFSTMARIQDTLLSLSRGLSRLMSDIVELIVKEWDYGDSPMVLSDLMATDSGMQEQTLELTKEMFQAVRGIDVQINPEVPINDTEEKSAIYQALASGAISLFRAIEHLGYAPDPEEELLRIGAERSAMSDPAALQAMRNQWFKMMGIDISQMAMAQQQQMAAQQTPNAPPSPSSPQSQAGPVPGSPQPGQAGPAAGGMDPRMAMAALMAQGQGMMPNGAA